MSFIYKTCRKSASLTGCFKNYFTDFSFSFKKKPFLYSTKQLMCNTVWVEYVQHLFLPLSHWNIHDFLLKITEAIKDKLNNRHQSLISLKRQLASQKHTESLKLVMSTVFSATAKNMFPLLLVKLVSVWKLKLLLTETKINILPQLLHAFPWELSAVESLKCRYFYRRSALSDGFGLCFWNQLILIQMMLNVQNVLIQ